MISQRVKQIQEQLLTLEELEESARNQDAIKATLQALESLQESTTELAELHELIYERLDERWVVQTDERVRTLDRNIQESCDEYHTNRRQVHMLTNIQAQIEQLLKDVKTSWKLYVEAQITPQFELLELVSKLPEVTEQLQELNTQKVHLEQYATGVPSNKMELTEFDRALHNLAHRLSALNLAPKITHFLTQILKGSATLEMVDDQILSWCRQGNRAKTFRITFK